MLALVVAKQSLACWVDPDIETKENEDENTDGANVA
jgi:hypothetical protein